MMIGKNCFDVFICHNSEDKNQVREVTNQIKNHGLTPWFDESEFRPGHLWQRRLDEQIQIIPSVAVFIGNSGLGPWQNKEVDAFLREAVKREITIIPVILKTVVEMPFFPLDLQGRTWVDFRIEEPDPFQRLIWGITGYKNFGIPRTTDFEGNKEKSSFSNMLSAENLKSFPYLQQWNPHDIEREIELIRKAYVEFSGSSLKDANIIDYLKKSESFIHKIRSSHHINTLSLRDELCVRLSLVDEWFLSLINDSDSRYKLRSLRIEFIPPNKFNN
jgi:hypothetical protein